jgi:O-antigen/teichoic acid export membrane protein
MLRHLCYCMKRLSLFKIYLSRFFSEGNERTIKAKKNIVISFGLQAISIIIGLIYVPLLINYLGAEEYGVWLTLSSVIGWFAFFDIGLGNGLRNKLTEALAKNDTRLAKEYVSTTYAIISLVFGFVLVLFYCINPFLDWSKILNTSVVGIDKLTLLAQVVFTFFVFRFIFQLIGTIYLAYQMPAVNNAISPVSNIISLLIILILLKTSDGSLLALGTVLSAVPVFVFIIFSFLAFRKRFHSIRPSINSIKFKHSRSLLSLGVKFFISQVAALILFSLSNIIIAQVLSPKEVTEYNIAFKYFSVSLMAITIVLSPIWSAVTDAYIKEDFNWLKSTLRKLNRLGIVFISIAALQLVFSDFIYRIWVGDKVNIPFILSLAMFFDIAWSSFSASYSSFINGFGKLKLGLIIVWFRLLVFVPMAIYMTKIFGVSGIVWASVLGKLFTIFGIIQVNKIINKRAYGIWNQ